MRYKYITKIEIKFDKKKTFKRKSIKYLQNYIFQESVKLPVQRHKNGESDRKTVDFRKYSLKKFAGLKIIPTFAIPKNKQPLADGLK